MVKILSLIYRRKSIKMKSNKLLITRKKILQIKPDYANICS